MRKVYLQVTLNVIVDTDLTSVNDIVDSLDFDVAPMDENVEVYDSEVHDFHVTDSK